MGGYGSGRSGGGRSTTDDYLRMDVLFMERNGYLKPHHSGNLFWSRGGERIGHISFTVQTDRLTLIYNHRTHGEVWEPVEYPVYLERTPCTYGGSRSWFLCPARGCGRRIATLFGGRIFACRKCYGLAYISQRVSRSDRATERADRILKRLRCEDMSILDPDPPRPKGMHAHTYRRLSKQYELARFQSFFYGPFGAMGWF